MKKILHAAEYPQLRMISIRNCLPLMDCRYLTGMDYFFVINL
jgi:hypothetical protein